MNNLKFGVLACGVVGLISVFLPQLTLGDASFTLWAARTGDAANVYTVIACYLAATVVGAMGVMKPPFLRWHSIVALLAFGLMLVKMRTGLPTDFLKGAIGMKLMGLSAIIGVVFSALTLAKPELAK